jgi:hypothetical protein
VIDVEFLNDTDLDAIAGGADDDGGVPGVDPIRGRNTIDCIVPVN